MPAHSENRELDVLERQLGTLTQVRSIDGSDRDPILFSPVHQGVANPRDDTRTVKRVALLQSRQKREVVGNCRGNADVTQQRANSAGGGKPLEVCATVQPPCSTRG